MRVVQLLPELHEGGVERGVVELNRELVCRGAESLVVSAGGRLAEQIDRDGGRHIVFDVASKNILTVPARVWQLRRLLRDLEPDILHARSRVPAWLAYLVNRKLGLPFVTTVHGFNSVNPYSRVMTFGDRVICVSGAIKEHIQKHYGVADDRIVVIPRGVDLVNFDPSNLDEDFISKFCRQYGLEGRFVLTTVGRITQLKDLETFIRAVGLVRDQVPEVLGLIVGGVHPDKQDYYSSLQRLVAELGLEEQIVFAGSQSRVAEIYALSDLVVCGSKKPESFGRAAAEALAMNVPVVATRHGGILDIVKDGETGLLFDVGSATDLAEKINKALSLEFKGLRLFIEKTFTLSAMVSRTLETYELLQDEDGKLEA